MACLCVHEAASHLSVPAVVAEFLAEKLAAEGISLRHTRPCTCCIIAELDVPAGGVRAHHVASSESLSGDFAACHARLRFEGGSLELSWPFPRDSVESTLGVLLPWDSTELIRWSSQRACVAPPGHDANLRIARAGASGRGLRAGSLELTWDSGARFAPGVLT